MVQWAGSRQTVGNGSAPTFRFVTGREDVAFVLAAWFAERISLAVGNRR
jgi:hypothetical protein